MSSKKDHYDCTQDARELYRSFAKKNELKFTEEENAHGDIFLTIERQPRLNFKLTLGLQSGDEANIGIDDFWSYISPYPREVDYIIETLNGLLNGTIRLVEYEQFGKATKRRLLNEENEIIYTEIIGIALPFVKETIRSVTSNKQES